MNSEGELVKYPASVLSTWDNYIRSQGGEGEMLRQGIEETFNDFCMAPAVQAALHIKSIPYIKRIMKGHHFTTDGSQLAMPAGDYEVIEEKVDFAHSGLWGTFVDVSVRNIKTGKVYMIPKGNAQLMGLIPIGKEIKKKDQYNRKLNRIDSKTGKYERCIHCDSETHRTSEHYDNKQEFTCPYCHDKFGDEVEYKDHGEAHKQKGEPLAALELEIKNLNKAQTKEWAEFNKWWRMLPSDQRKSVTDKVGNGMGAVFSYYNTNVKKAYLHNITKPIRGHDWDYWQKKLMSDGYDKETANKIIGSWEKDKAIRSDDKNRKDRRNGTNVYVKSDEDITDGELEEIYQEICLKLDRIENKYLRERTLGSNDAQIRNRINYQQYVAEFANYYDISKDLVVDLMSKWGAVVHKTRDGSNASDAGNRDNSHQQGKGDDYQSNIKPSKKDDMSTDTSGVYNPVNNKPKKDREKDGRIITYLPSTHNVALEVGVMTPNHIQGVTPVYKEEIDIDGIAGEFYKGVEEEFDSPDKPDKPDKETKPDKIPKPEKPDKPEKAN